MDLKIVSQSDVSKFPNLIILSNHKTEWSKYPDLVTPAVSQLIKDKLAEKVNPFVLHSGKETLFVAYIEEKKEKWQEKESARKLAYQIIKSCNAQRIFELGFINTTEDSELAYAFVEGLALSAYRFDKYFTQKKGKDFSGIQKITVEKNTFSKENLDEIKILTEAVFMARNWVNEPANILTAQRLADELKKAAQSSGATAEIFDKKKIESLKMGGLLAVNSGSLDPPTFTVLEYKPTKHRNKKPIVLVGKGIVFDTGGLSLKPTTNSMDMMKCDMSGAATAGAVLYAVAKSKLPLHVVALVPATDNRPGEKAYAPGDVIRMMDGSTVEVLNSDAEGRMILADALHYAKKYKPELVIDIATLTGSALRALGHFATAYMGTAPDSIKKQIIQSSLDTYERLWEFPLWEEYGTLLQSDIADQKNIGGELAGMITAGKFLEKFIDYPWLHLDIAGTAFLTSESDYKGKGATGVGVRLLYHFLKNYQA